MIAPAADGCNACWAARLDFTGILIATARVDEALTRVCVCHLVPARKRNGAGARIEVSRRNVRAARWNPHLHHVCLSAAGFEFSDQSLTDASATMRFSDADFIEEHHLLIAVDAIQQICEKVADRHAVIRSDNQDILRARQKSKEIPCGGNRIAVRCLEQPDGVYPHLGVVRSKTSDFHLSFPKSVSKSRVIEGIY